MRLKRQSLVYSKVWSLLTRPTLDYWNFIFSVSIFEGGHTMKRSLWLIVWLLMFFGMSVAQAAEPSIHVVTRGETLRSIAGASWKAVCKANNLADCNKIRVGQKIHMTVGQTPKMSLLTIITKNPACITLGVAPLNAEHRLELALEGIDALMTLTPKQKETAKQKFKAGQKASSRELVGTQHFGEMLYRSKVSKKVVHVYDKPICTPDEGGQTEVMDTYDLGDGVFLANPKRCGNIATFTKAARKPEPVVPQPVVQPETVVPEVAVTSSGCPLDPKAVIGQEHEPKHSGNDAHSTYLAGAVYCTWRGENGTHGVGIGGQASMWTGLVNGGAGRFSGHFAALGPAYEYISDNGWDFEAKALIGRLDEHFVQGDYYRSERHFTLIGPALSYNNYERRQHGEQWFPETQLSGVLGFPLTKSVAHSWQGKAIENTTELSKFGVYFNAAIRQWIYDGDVVQPYVQLGYFLESPSSESMSFRVGFADPHRVCGIGFGFDHDLKSGGNAKAWGWWCDLIKGAEVVRDHHRLSQVIEKGDVKVVNGIYMMPLDDDETQVEAPAEEGTVAQAEVPPATNTE